MFGRKRLNMKNAARNRQWNIRITNRKERRRARAKTSFVSDLVDMSIKEMNEMAVIADLTGQLGCTVGQLEVDFGCILESIGVPCGDMASM